MFDTWESIRINLVRKYFKDKTNVFVLLLLQLEIFVTIVATKAVTKEGSLKETMKLLKPINLNTGEL